MKHDERAGTVRANDAFAVYEHMNDNYSYDLIHSNERKSVSSFQIKRDYHRFIVNQNQYVPDLMDRHGDKIIIVTASNCDKNNKAIPNIRQTYQWRFDTSFEPGCMEVRQTTCFCQNCLNEDFENCLTSSKWQAINLNNTIQKKRKTSGDDLVEKTLENREFFDDTEEFNYEDMDL